MTQRPPRHPSASDPEHAGGATPHQDEPESGDAAQEPAELSEESDPYDDLWDPDMDTRPERIRKTKARSRTESRTRGGPPPRGKRREGM
jgi:hypothetical protein